MIELTDVRFRYDASASGAFELRVDRLALGAGSRTAVVGPSGSGKTTLLHLIAGILTPVQGRVAINHEDLGGLPDAQRRRARLRSMGMVFQDIQLLDYLSVRDNILLPYRLGGGLVLDREAKGRAESLAQRVGLGDKLGRAIDRLSQGERQRVAICRALVARPKLLLADEPTSALDADTARATLDLVFELAEETGTTLVVLTHDPSVLERFDRVVHVNGGGVS
jgi:putative ABC transport system ATP-binding protein